MSLALYGVLVFTLMIIFLYLYRYRKKALEYKGLYEQEKSRKSSISIKHGKTIEKFAPWMDNLFPYNPENFRFIGDPVDGIVFDEDRLVFVEFKTGKSNLTESQKNIKKLIRDKEIEWKTVRID